MWVKIISFSLPRDLALIDFLGFIHDLTLPMPRFTNISSKPTGYLTTYFLQYGAYLVISYNDLSGLV
jgi:hypothetical protein